MNQSADSHSVQRTVVTLGNCDRLLRCTGISADLLELRHLLYADRSRGQEAAGHLLLQKPETVRYLSRWLCRHTEGPGAGGQRDSAASSSTSCHDTSPAAEDDKPTHQQRPSFGRGAAKVHHQLHKLRQTSVPPAASGFMVFIFTNCRTLMQGLAALCKN